MLGKKLINPGAVACTTDTTQILDGGTTQSAALYRFEDNANDTAYTAGSIVSSNRVIDLDVNGYSSGTTITDSTSNYNNATIVGNVTYSNPSSSNGRFNLDGASDYLRIGASTTFNSAANFTLEGWFKPDNITDLDHFFTIWDGSSNSKLYLRFTGTSGDLNGYTYTSGGSESANISTSNAAVRVQANVFNHIVMTYTDGGSGSIAVYINGALAGSATPSAAVNTTGAEDLYVGTLKSYHGTYDFDGEVGQIRFYNNALTAAEVLQNFNATRALYAAYDGDDASITFTNKTTAAPTYNSSGKFGKSAIFNGSTSAIKYPDDFWKKQIFSISCWFKADDVSSTYQTLFSAYSNDGSHKGFVMAIDTNKISYVHGITVHRGSTTLLNSTWYHFVLVLDGSEARGYLNGVLDLTVTSITSVTYQSSGQKFFTGIRPQLPGSNYAYGEYDGEIDQMRFFEKALSLGEINSLYNETATSAALGTITNPSTIAYYKMADATDETGSYNGTPTDVDFNVQGKYGFAGKFNGSSSRINTGLIWPGGTEISCSLWINTAGGVNQYLLGGFNDSGSNSSNRFSFQFHNSNVLYILTNNASGGMGTTTNAGSIASYLNKWTHIVVTVSGTAVKAYLDGSLFHTSTGTALAAGSQPFIIGAYTDNSSRQNVNGKIDQVRIFNKAISADEVTKLYNEIQCANTITTPESYFNTVAYSNPSTSQAYAVGFAPDLVWFKERTGTSSHQLYDTIRTDHEALFSNKHDGEYDYSNHPNGDLAPTITSTGFTTPSVVNGGINTSNDSYVAWAWKAASSNTTNNDGTIASTVRASQESGFSNWWISKSNKT